MLYEVITAKHPIVDNFNLTKVRGAFSAAAPLSETVANALFARVGFRLSQAYGMTEVSGASHLGPTTPDKIKPASGGRLMPRITSYNVCYTKLLRQTLQCYRVYRAR